MSHELRTPLNIINGFSKLMTRRSNVPLDETTVREYGDCIHEAGEHLLKVINDIIEFSEAGSGATSYDPVPVDPKSLLASAVSLAVGFNRTGSLDGIRVSVSPALGELIVDEMAIRRVLISLVSNAIRFGGSPLAVTIRAHVRDDGCPVISVSDNGGGLSPDEIEQVFRPFFQCDRHRGGDFAGTGLGLTISRQLAHLHGGDIVMRSR
ncbi:MAG: HAMP domain-containing sensor histidine kinase, partial [Pseudomonadota bacterium]